MRLRPLDFSHGAVLAVSDVGGAAADAARGRQQTGYFGVCLTKPGMPKPYQARVRRDGKQVHLGSFATAEEAAMCIARSPEGREAAAAAAVVRVS